MERNRHLRWLFTSTVLVVVALPFVGWGAKEATENIYNSPPTWVPEDFPQRRLYEAFLAEFEGNDVVVLAWDGCTVDDPRLAELEAALLAAQEERAAAGRERLYARAMSGHSALRRLMDHPIELSREVALARLRGVLVGPDGATSCLIALPTLYGAYHREEALDALLGLAERIVKIDRREMYLVGPPVDGYVIDLESMESLRFYTIPSMAVSLLLCWLFLRSVPLTAAVFAVASVGGMFALALVHYSGQQMNAVLIVLSPLVFVVTVSGGVHLVNYYYEAVRQHGPEGAAARALQAGWLPCTLAAVTTAVGLGSLSVSRLEPITAFALISAAGVLSSVGLLLLVMPGAMELAGPPRRAASRHPVDAPRSRNALRRWPELLAGQICRRPLLWIALSLGVIAVSGWGLRFLHVSVNVRGLFVGESRIVRDYQWFESHIGPMVPVEVVLHFGAECPLDEVQRLELVSWASYAVRQIEGVEGVVSAATLLPPIPTRFVARTVFRHRLEEGLGELEGANYLYEDGTRQSWRISARVSALDDLDYGLVLQRLEEHVEPFLADLPEGMDVRASYTGVMSLVDEAQRALLHDLTASFLTALFVIGAVLVLVTRSLTLGTLAMLPNLLPATVVFGTMGWRGTPVDIGSMMTASVGLGFCVDGTLHFLKWFRLERDAGRSPVEALEVSYRHCGRALVQAAAICGLGLLVFAYSEFVPTRRFAWIMLSILTLGLAADLVLLPALLASPLGGLFFRRRAKRLPESREGGPTPQIGSGKVERLTGAQETLLIPLWARALEHDQGDPILRDPKAVELLSTIDYPFERFRGGASSQVACCLRAAIIDGWVRRHLEEHPEGPVVEIGAGLDTRFDRLDNDRVRWFDLDLAGAMALRRRFFHETSRRTFITGSVMEPQWLSAVEAIGGGPPFFIAEGVLYYLPKEEVRDLFSRLADRFPGCCLAFDCHSPLSRLYSQLFDPVRRTAGKLQWGVRRPETIAAWDPRFRVEESIAIWDTPQYWQRYRGRLPRGLQTMLRWFPPSRRTYRIERVRLGPLPAAVPLKSR